VLTHGSARPGILRAMFPRLLTWMLACAFLAAQGSAEASQTAPSTATDVPISEYVRRVFEDRAGNLWLGTNGEGVARFDGTQLTWFDGRNGFAGRAIRGIAETPDGAVWVASDAGVGRYLGGTWANFTTANGLAADDTWSLFGDRTGTIWVGTVKGVCRLVGAKFELFPLPVVVATPESRFDPRVVWRMCQDRDGVLWFATDGNGVHAFDGKAITSLTVNDGLPANNLRAVFIDSKARMWFGCDGNGLACRDGTTWRHFTQKDGLANDRVFELGEDAAGHLWISTLGAGLTRWDGTRCTTFGAADGLTKSHVQSILSARDGRLWIGCSGGLFRRDGERFVHVGRAGPWR